MSLIVTPRRLAQRGDFFHQLDQLTAAGIDVPQALQIVGRNPPSRSFRKWLPGLLRQLEQGSTFTEALSRERSWLTTFDIALLATGERSGRLPESFALLANYYEERSRLVRAVWSNLAYPLFILHFAVFIMPFPQLFLSGQWHAYLGQTLGLLVPLYLVALGISLVCQEKRSETWRFGIEQGVRWVPVLGAARRSLALARLSTALEALINAGVTIIEAWELAAAACGSPTLRRTVMAWKPRLVAGQTPAEAVAGSGVFPTMFTSLYQTGEISGKLDETLRQLFRYYRDDGFHRLRLLAEWFPRLVYFAVMLRIAFQVIGFYSSYFQGVQQVIGQ